MGGPGKQDKKRYNSGMMTKGQTSICSIPLVAGTEVMRYFFGELH